MPVEEQGVDSNDAAEYWSDSCLLLLGRSNTKVDDNYGITKIFVDSSLP